MNTKCKQIGTQTLAAVTAAVLGTTFLGVGQIAWAEADNPGPFMSRSTVAESIDSIGALLAVPSDKNLLTTGSVDLGEGAITVPIKPEQGVALESENGSVILIGLPDTEDSSLTEIIEPGVVSYLNEQTASSVVVTDYGVQILTTIASANAPTRYDYQLTLDEGQRLDLTEDGLPAIFAADGSVVAAVATPWAQDANGLKIPTKYEIDKNTLTQVVDHTASTNVVYPVTADPIWIAPRVFRCLLGLGLKGPDITRIATLGTPGSIGAAFGRAAVACIFGK